MKRNKELFKNVDVSKNITKFEDKLLQMMDEFEQKTGLAVTEIDICSTLEQYPRVDISFKKK